VPAFIRTSTRSARLRFTGAALAALFAALPASAQNNDRDWRDSDQIWRGDTSTRPAGKLRRPVPGKASAQPTRPAAARAGAAQPLPATDAGSTGNADGAARLAAVAAAKKKARVTPPPATAAQDATAIAPAERLALEFELAWTGDYNSLTGLDSNDKLVAAIRSFQRQRKFRETGVLNSQERALLAASAKAKQAQVGWTMLDDAVTGSRLGVPTRQTPLKTQSRTGSRWTSAQGQIQIETFKIREPGTTLAAVYEQQRKEPATRRVDSNHLKGDGFIISGMQGLKKFFVRAEYKDGEVRGLTVLWDQATETLVDPVAMAMASGFTPFPGINAVAAIGAPPKPKVEYGTGIVVSSAGHILTDRQITDGCNVIVVSGYGDAATLAEDKAADLALLRVYGAPDLVPAPLTAEGKGPELTLVGIADPQSQNGGSAVTTAPVQLKGDAVDPTPQPGFSGAAALDNQGRFAGMAGLKIPAVAAVGAAPQPQATIVPLPAIRSFLDAQQVTPAAGTTGIDAAKASVVRVICVRK
jgi:hypothetical protein